MGSSETTAVNTGTTVRGSFEALGAKQQLENHFGLKDVGSFRGKGNYPLLILRQSTAEHEKRKTYASGGRAKLWKTATVCDNKTLVLKRETELNLWRSQSQGRGDLDHAPHTNFAQILIKTLGMFSRFWPFVQADTAWGLSWNNS